MLSEFLDETVSLWAISASSVWRALFRPREPDTTSAAEKDAKETIIKFYTETII